MNYTPKGSGQHSRYGSPDPRNYLAKAASGSSSNVSYSINRMQPGGVLHVPAGASAWTNSLTISNAITLRWGNGTLMISTGTVTWDGTNMVPGSGSAVVASTNSISASWSAATDTRVIGWQLRYGTIGGSLSTLAITTNSASITNISAGSYYAFLTSRDVYGNESTASTTNYFTIN